MEIKLDTQHKHILSLINRDAEDDGWASVSDKLLPILSTVMPKELVTFETLDVGGRARLTEDGKSVVLAMEWL